MNCYEVVKMILDKLLQDVILGNTTVTEIVEQLSIDEKAYICDWYLKYSTVNNYNIVNIIELMVDLYSKYDIDVYPIELYMEEKDYICKKYDVKNDNFPEMISSFKKLWAQ